MSNSLSRAIIDAHLPDGAAFAVAPGGDFDKLLQGVADCDDLVLDDLRALNKVRDPLSTDAQVGPNDAAGSHQCAVANRNVMRHRA